MENDDDETVKILRELGIDPATIEHESQSASSSLHPLAALSLGCFFAANFALLLSLPPVLRGKGK